MRAKRRTARASVGALSAALAVGMIVAGAQAGSAQSRSAARPSGTATVAQLFAPSYIFPFFPAADATNASELFQSLFYRPLYYYPNKLGEEAVDPVASIALPPVWTNGGKTAVITLKPWKWSNGEPVSAKDLIFFLNLFKAEKTQYGLYIPGEIPDNIVSYRATGPRTVSITFNAVYSHQFLILDQLNEITPMPMAWDLVSKTQQGRCADTPAACAPVLKYLLSQAKTPTSYPSNPLWQVVDGPWKLQSFSTDGSFTIVPNPRYSGPAPHLAEVKYETFTDETSEYNVLRSGGQIDVGWLPLADAAPKPANAAVGPNPVSGYTIVPTAYWGAIGVPINLNNPKVGAIFRQTYVRQAMQLVVDQPAYVKAFMNGYGYVQAGPVPSEPPNQFQAPIDHTTGPLAFDPAKAEKLLRSHGWTIDPNGADTCSRPGSAASDCGPGVKAGARLSFTAAYVNSPAWIGQSMQQYKSDASRIGIQISLSEGPFSTVYGAAQPCKATQAACSWEISNFDGIGNYGYPVGALYFSSTGALNYGHWVDPKAQQLIQQTATSSSPSAMQAYDLYLAKQVPMLWWPMPVDGLDEVSSSLHGAIPSPALHGSAVAALTNPEYWSKS